MLRKRWFRWAVISAAILLLASEGFSLLLRTAASRRYLTARLESSFGRPVEVRAFSFSLLDGPRIEAFDVSVAEDPRFGQEYFLRAEQLTAGRVDRHVTLEHLVGDREALVHPRSLRPPPAGRRTPREGSGERVPKQRWRRAPLQPCSAARSTPSLEGGRARSRTHLAADAAAAAWRLGSPTGGGGGGAPCVRPRSPERTAPGGSQPPGLRELHHAARFIGG